jgi:hypothetical protein
LTGSDLPENVRKFIFEFIDSVEQLDILLLMHAHRDQYWNAKTLSHELRSNVNSVQARLQKMSNLGLIQENPQAAGDFQYGPQNAEWDKTITDLAEIYPTKKHRVLELVFTPLKQVRLISNAFRLSQKKSEDGGNDV